jgi:site-specific DNA recombinase
MGVTIRSATEPFDTGTAIGKFLFQLLGSLAELEKSTIIERMTMGRDRVAREGKWTDGPVPFGYDISDQNCLIPSQRVVPMTGQTESDIVRSIFRRMADGSTTPLECQRLNAMGVPTERRYSNGRIVTVGERWLPTRVIKMLRSTTYYGIHIYKSKHGSISREVPALVDRATWDAAIDQVVRNRRFNGRYSEYPRLLRGLITCDCGFTYIGITRRDGKTRLKAGEPSHWYRCNRQSMAYRPNGEPRCYGKMLKQAWIEDLVWADCRSFIQDPAAALEEARRELRERLRQSTAVEESRRQVSELLRGKETERERIMTLYRRGRANLGDTETQLDAINQEAAELQAMLGAMRAQQELAESFETQLTDATTLLVTLREQLAEIEQSNDIEAKRKVVELLVAGITVRTEGRGTRKIAQVSINYRFSPPRAVEGTSHWSRSPTS